MNPLQGDELPRLQTTVPGPQSRAWIDRLAVRECPAVTARRARRADRMGVADTDPIVWAEARGAVVQDTDGNRFVDLTAGFGVMGVGHRNDAVVAAGTRQMNTLLHAMGDAFPDTGRIALMERLCARTGFDRVLFGSSGSDSIDAAVKTARMATNRDAVVVFDRGYHGLAFGALALSRYLADQFRTPFAGQLGPHSRVAPYGGQIPDLSDVACVVVEPIQGRGGVRVPPAGWLQKLRTACDQHGTLLVYDEIYTGMARTGPWFAFEASGARPDLLCVGKGLAGGFPLSACLGTKEAMDAWGASTGQALHTQTFLGHPVGCAMALAALKELEELQPTVTPRSLAFRNRLEAEAWEVQGAGWLLGLRHPDAPRACRQLLEQGILALPAGEHAEVIALTPPFCITDAQLDAAAHALGQVR